MNQVGQDLTATLTEDRRNQHKQKKLIRRITDIYLHPWMISEDTVQWYQIAMYALCHYLTYGHVNDIIVAKYLVQSEEGELLLERTKVAFMKNTYQIFSSCQYDTR